MLEQPEHYTTAEVAAKLRITPDGVAKRIKRGELPAVRVGRRWLIPRKTFDAMLQLQAPQGQ
jgi:excisionase family DNA binding protein